MMPGARPLCTRLAICLSIHPPGARLIAEAECLAPMDVPQAGSLTPHWGCESPHQWSTSKIPKVSLPDALCKEVGCGRGHPEAEVRHPFDCSQLSLPSSSLSPTAIPSPGQVMHAHRAQGKDSRAKGQTWTRINTVWMAAFYISERSWSVTIDLWPNVVWTEPTEAASAPPWPTLHHSCPLLGSAQHGGTGMRVTGYLRILPILPSPSPSPSPYCYLGSGALEAAVLVGSVFPSVSIGVW